MSTDEVRYKYRCTVHVQSLLVPLTIPGTKFMEFSTVVGSLYVEMCSKFTTQLHVRSVPGRSFRLFS